MQLLDAAFLASDRCANLYEHEHKKKIHITMYVISQRRRRCLDLWLRPTRVSSGVAPRRGSLSVHVPIIILARRNAPRAAIQQSVGHSDSWLRQRPERCSSDSSFKAKTYFGLFFSLCLFFNPIFVRFVLRKFYEHVSITDPDRRTHTLNYVCVRLDHSYNYCYPACSPVWLPACLPARPVSMAF